MQQQFEVRAQVGVIIREAKTRDECIALVCRVVIQPFFDEVANPLSFGPVERLK
jgi:hypothetical protein